MEVSYKIPEEIKKFKPKGTMIKRFGNKYYVYKHSSFWDKESKKVKSKSGEMIGKITVENGFIPNSKINKEKINKKAVDVKSTAKDYDSCYAADNTYSETYDDLLESLYAKKNNKQKVITDSEKLDMLLKIVIGLTKRIENTNAKVEEMDKKLKKTEQQTEENTKQLSRIIKLNKLKS